MAKKHKAKMVTTINGVEADIEKCRKFEKGYYLIGDLNVKDSGDCYYIAGRFYRQETEGIVFNYSINSYVVKDNLLMEAVVDINEDSVVTGNVTKQTYDYNLCVNGHVFPVFCVEKLLADKLYREELSTGLFWHVNEIPAAKLIAMKVPKVEYKHSLQYDSKNITEGLMKEFEDNFNEPIGYYAQELAKVIGDLTFGVEFETTKGYIPKRITNKYGILPLRDGSITGIEYVTVPMRGAKGIQSVVNFLEELDKRTEFDTTCSLHVHLGGVPRTKEFILAFAKLTMALQDQIFRMFPLYKKYNFKIKNKNYSAPFPTYELMSRLDKIVNDGNINANFSILYEFLSGGQHFKDVGNDLKNVESHPSDSNGTQKWNIRSRYLIHNLVPLLFGNKQTIEFRIHTGTTDPGKVIAFIVLNACLVNYTIKNQKGILGNPRELYGLHIQDIVNEQINARLKDSVDRYGISNSFARYLTSRDKYTEDYARDKGVRGAEESAIPTIEFDWKQLEPPPILTREEAQALADKGIYVRQLPNGSYTTSETYQGGTYDKKPPRRKSSVDTDTYERHRWIGNNPSGSGLYGSIGLDAKIKGMASQEFGADLGEAISSFDPGTGIHSYSLGVQPTHVEPKKTRVYIDDEGHAQVVTETTKIAEDDIK